MEPFDNKPCEFDHRKQKERLRGYRNTLFPSPLSMEGWGRKREKERKERMRKGNERVSE